MPHPGNSGNNSLLSQAQDAYNSAVNAYNEWCTRIEELTAKKDLLDAYIEFLEEYKNEIHSNVYDELEYLPNCMNAEVEHTCQGLFIENLFSNCYCDDSPTLLKSMTIAYEDEVENTKAQAIACRDDINENIYLFAGYRDEVSAEVSRLASDLESLRSTISDTMSDISSNILNLIR
ncbi:MAG: hypothetical protein K6F49_03635 [Saccharofermentans sp.]|nr:hypothetical protein [Saccharofermentans sp.]